MSDLLFAAAAAAAIYFIGPLLFSSALTFAIVACIAVVVIDLAMKAAR